MTRIAFIGLGNMGAGMAANQAKAGNDVAAFDLSAAALEKAVAERPEDNQARFDLVGPLACFAHCDGM